MFKNYFTLNRLVLEVNELLLGSEVYSIFTQAKDKLVLCFIKNSKEYFIEINTERSLPYFILKNQFTRAKKNTLNFFELYLPSTLVSIKIAEFDRIIQFNLVTASIYFYLRGNETNVFLVDNQKNISTFKKGIDGLKQYEYIQKLNFTDQFLSPKFIDLRSADSLSVLSKKYPFLGREILEELEVRVTQDTSTNKQKVLEQLLYEIKTLHPFVYTDTKTGDLKLSFFLNIKKRFEGSMSFATVNEALKYMITKTHITSKTKNIVADLESKIESKINKLEKKRSYLKERIMTGCMEEKYKKIGNILLMNLNNIPFGIKNIQLENFYDSNKLVNIELITKLTPQENANSYFQKAKSERKEFEQIKKIYEEIEVEIDKLKIKLLEIQSSHTSPNSDSQLDITNALKIPKAVSDKSLKTKFRQFLLFDKYLIYVGKDSRNNDELTTSFAKQNDYWFHARSVSGSHVVLRWDKSLGEIQKSILVKAASIAAFYSKAKTSGLVPVSYTQKKFVIKRKGMEPGKVVLLKEKVLIVKPEIPKECTQLSADKLT
jgi:predicted ribosome quality control (RQC) complex YloA/Tae2 family protein